MNTDDPLRKYSNANRSKPGFHELPLATMKMNRKKGWRRILMYVVQNESKIIKSKYGLSIEIKFKFLKEK